jgi:hypothetical protein
MPGGRPSSYDPSVNEKVLELGKQGKTLCQIACALDVMRSTLYEWAKNYPEFSDTLKKAQEYSQSFWEHVGQTGMVGKIKGFKEGTFKYYMSCRYRDDYQEKTVVEQTNVNPPTIKVCLESESDKTE